MGYFKNLAIEQEEQNDPLCKYPMVEGLVYDMRSIGGLTTDLCLEVMKESFDRLGPYEFAKLNGKLVNNSGEEFAMQFMAFWNEVKQPGTY